MWMGTRHMKILNIANHQGTTNQNHNEISHHICHQKEYNRYWQGYGEKETLVHCWWECKLAQSLWKTVWEVSQKAKNRTTIMTQEFHFWIYTTPQKNKKQKNPLTGKDPCSPNVHNSITFNCQGVEATCVHQQMNEQRRCGVYQYIQWNTTQS